MREALLFLKEFAKNPGDIGAIAPSSSGLAASMIRSAGVQPGQVVVELGAGTGPFTQAVRDRAPHTPFLAFEPSETLAASLRARFPELTVVERYASDLPEVLEEWGHTEVDRVISGLPWSIFPAKVQDSTLDEVRDCLVDDGCFVTFMYVHAQLLPAASRLKAALAKRFASVKKSEITWANVPPAFVFICTQPIRPSGETTTRA